MKKSVEKVCEMFVLEDYLLKLKQNELFLFPYVRVVTSTSRTDLECAGFVLFQCKNKIPRATERQDVLIAKSVSVTAIHHAWLD